MKSEMPDIWLSCWVNLIGAGLYAQITLEDEPADRPFAAFQAKHAYKSE